MPAQVFPTDTLALEPETSEYTVGWLCAFQEEYGSSCGMLDEEFEGPEYLPAGELNTYAYGRIGRHNIVIGSMSAERAGDTGPVRAGRDMARSFPQLKFALLVGIGGGAPSAENDVRLGDVVVSKPSRILEGLLSTIYGNSSRKVRPRRDPMSVIYQRAGQFNAPLEIFLGVIPEVRRHYNDPNKPDMLAEHMSCFDLLYESDYVHRGGSSCDECEEGRLRQRPKRQIGRAVAVHHETMVSGSWDPDLNILCFETEAAVLVNQLPCLVIRGVCHYSDSYINDVWHRYASLTAAAYARELLMV
ncbi:hypothetical protein BDV12DRAFT_186103 [Aspergillus spectabilis]